jgi:c(7)-type cytochrome triheme protein
MAMRIRLFGLVVIGTLLAIAAFEARGQMTDSPTLPPADEYGNMLINRTSEKNKVKPAIFSHWVHRQWHTCRVCHFELGFKYKLNATEITEEANRAGKFCGAAGCHDDKTEYGGKVVFGHIKKEDCEKCHNGNLRYGNDRFEEVKKKLPPDKYGNGIDWMKALEKGMIKPIHIVTMKPPPDLKMVKLLRFKGAWNVPLPPVAFSHKKHSRWLDCNNCHPELFPLPLDKEEKEGTKDEKDPEKEPEKTGETKPQPNAEVKAETKPAKNVIKSLGEKHQMMAIFKGESCGLCHLKVAFPINDCPRCHPGMEGGY